MKSGQLPVFDSRIYIVTYKMSTQNTIQLVKMSEAVSYKVGTHHTHGSWKHYRTALEYQFGLTLANVFVKVNITLGSLSTRATVSGFQEQNEKTMWQSVSEARVRSSKGNLHCLSSSYKIQMVDHYLEAVSEDLRKFFIPEAASSYYSLKHCITTGKRAKYSSWCFSVNYDPKWSYQRNEALLRGGI